MSNRAEIFMTFKNWEETEITRCQQNKITPQSKLNLN